jgi:hypothetical protein
MSGNALAAGAAVEANAIKAGAATIEEGKEC